jgi:hypothetical protein
MSNMSYCRFENTLRDLKDCYRNMANPESEDEKTFRKLLVELCKKIADNYYGDV